MKPFKPFTLCFLFLNLLSGCTVKSEHQYEYVPLEEFHYQNASILPGAELRLLAFSGGEKGDDNNVYYYQFIVLNKSNNDTLRILTPLISIDGSAGVENKTYTTPLQYDPEKGIFDAVFEAKDDSQNLMLQIDDLIKDEKVDNSVDVQSLTDRVNKKEFVVINKDMKELESANYKTAIGILNFKQIPW